MAVASIGEILKSGKSTKGRSATTGMGMASVTQREIIKAAMAITLLASSFTSKGLT